ncbi:DUF605-domain-containing protein [Macrolepiota fuliginosa MF-IS2]|uniref:DUF605-domain-containing protein n=1 Tax=Macrolepiota fuliginosa MF-IS2 TaxID=1400762 RepID=A0A9P5XRQ2_9AGAR|nr:DUF605-domain-containing protein [Macrolepiota fuliginosa MF-IS2]
MSTLKLLGLPPISPDLKPILPFLQRAEELKKQDPVVAYWCAYYAAQLGIGLKARDNASRDVLFSLLGELESMKKKIGSVDAIESEVASAAYVENFALRIFQSADNEDRRGVATKTTARKFLAASNFLEVLKTFPKTEVSDSNEEKIRYAKWKAADIAKALREGHRPTPGPAGQGEDFQPPEERPSVEEASLDQSSDAMFAKSQSSARLPSPPTVPSDTSYGSPPKNVQGRHRNGSGSSTHSGSTPKHRKTSISEEMEGKITPSSSPPRPSAMKSPGRESSPEGKKKVHFSSSAEVVPPPAPPALPKPPSPAEIYQGPPSIYASHLNNGTPSPPSAPAAGSSPPRLGIHPAAPSPAVSYSPPRTNIYALPTQPANYGYASSPPKSYPPTVPPPPSSAPAPIPPSRSVELTPSLITKVQKHCRFAISSLDYEDAEQAKKELREALFLLGDL